MRMLEDRALHGARPSGAVGLNDEHRVVHHSVSGGNVHNVSLVDLADPGGAKVVRSFSVSTSSSRLSFSPSGRYLLYAYLVNTSHTRLSIST